MAEERNPLKDNPAPAPPDFADEWASSLGATPPKDYRPIVKPDYPDGELQQLNDPRKTIDPIDLTRPDYSDTTPAKDKTDDSKESSLELSNNTQWLAEASVIEGFPELEYDLPANGASTVPNLFQVESEQCLKKKQSQNSLNMSAKRTLRASGMKSLRLSRALLAKRR